MSSPYRDADALGCVRCGTAMTASATGELACDDHGTWVPHGVLAKLLDDPKLTSSGGIPYWKIEAFARAKCPVCHDVLEDVYVKLGEGALVLGQCERDGVWVERGSRAQLEAAFADEIEKHARAVSLRDPEQAPREAAARIEALEQRCAQLEQHVADLQRIVNRIKPWGVT